MDDLAEVPLDREEESARQFDDEGRPSEASDLLFGTLLSALNPKPPISVGVDATAADACEKMREHKIGCVLVMDGDKLVGIFTERDVVYKLTCHEGRPADLKIVDLMTPSPTTLRAGHSLAHALNKMSLDGCRHIPIVNRQGAPTGMVSVRRIVDYLVDHFAQELLNLPPDPDQDLSITRAEGG